MQVRNVDLNDMEVNKMPFFINDACILCGNCEIVCPNDAIVFANERYVIREEACNACANCAVECPVESITMR